MLLAVVSCVLLAACASAADLVDPDRHSGFYGGVEAGATHVENGHNGR